VDYSLLEVLSGWIDNIFHFQQFFSFSIFPWYFSQVHRIDQLGDGLLLSYRRLSKGSKLKRPNIFSSGQLSHPKALVVFGFVGNKVNNCRGAFFFSNKTGQANFSGSNQGCYQSR